MVHADGIRAPRPRDAGLPSPGDFLFFFAPSAFPRPLLGRRPLAFRILYTPLVLPFSLFLYFSKMISTSTIFTALLLSAAAQVRAANDWAVPCTSGQCSYDVASKADSIPASMRIVSVQFVCGREEAE
jgi:hypothetical protein